MLESLIMKGRQLVSLPWSGPGGKKVLKGDVTLGYMGVVSQEELITDKRFLEEAALEGRYDNLLIGSGNWHKFVKEGRILYIRQQPLLRTTWYRLYEAGVMYGTRDVGSYSEYLRTSYNVEPTYQYKPIRVSDGGVPKYVVPKSISLENELLTDVAFEDDESDWKLLIGAIVTPVDGGTGNFNRLPYSQVAGTVGSVGEMGVNRRINVPSIRSKSPDSYTAVTGYSIFGGSYAWRPMLELIPDGEYAFGPDKLEVVVSGATVGGIEVTIETDVQESEVETGVNFGSVSWLEIKPFEYSVDTVPVSVTLTSASFQTLDISIEDTDTLEEVGLTQAVAENTLNQDWQVGVSTVGVILSAESSKKGFDSTVTVSNVDTVAPIYLTDYDMEGKTSTTLTDFETEVVSIAVEGTDVSLNVTFEPQYVPAFTVSGLETNTDRYATLYRFENIGLMDISTVITNGYLDGFIAQPTLQEYDF